MTELLEHPLFTQTEPKSIEKVAIVVSKGSLEGVYPGLIMANGARMEGIEADVFFTFFALDAIRKDRCAKLKVATVGNPPACTCRPGSAACRVSRRSPPG